MPWITIGSAVVGGVLSAASNDSEPTTSSSGNEAQWNEGNQSAAWQPNAALYPAYGSAIENLNALSQTPQEYFPGQTYVDPSANTQAAVGDLESAAAYNRAAPGYYDQAAGQYAAAVPSYTGAAGYLNKGAGTLDQASGQMANVANRAGTNYDFLSGAADVANNPYVQGMLSANERSVMDTLTNKALPGLQQGAVGVNSLGSSRLGLAQGQAIGDSMKALANQNAETQMNAYSQGLGAQQNALSQTGNLQNAYGAQGMAQAQAGRFAGEAGGMREKGGAALGQAGQQVMNSAGAYNQAAQNSANAGKTVEGYQQAALDDAMARHDWQTSEPWNRTENTIAGLNALSNLGTTNTQTTSNSYGNSESTAANPSYQSDWQSALGGAVTGAGVGNKLSNYNWGS